MAYVFFPAVDSGENISRTSVKLSHLSDEECYQLKRFPRPAMCNMLADDIRHPTDQAIFNYDYQYEHLKICCDKL